MLHEKLRLKTDLTLCHFVCQPTISVTPVSGGGAGVRAKQSLGRALALQPNFGRATEAREPLASLRVR